MADSLIWFTLVILVKLLKGISTTLLPVDEVNRYGISGLLG